MCKDKAFLRFLKIFLMVFPEILKIYFAVFPEILKILQAVFPENLIISLFGLTEKGFLFLFDSGSAAEGLYADF